MHSCPCVGTPQCPCIGLTAVVGFREQPSLRALVYMIWVFLKKKKIFCECIHMYGHFACMYVYVLCMCLVPWETRKDIRCTEMQLLMVVSCGVSAGFARRAALALNHWVSLQPHGFVLRFTCLLSHLCSPYSFWYMEDYYFHLLTHPLYDSSHVILGTESPRIYLLIEGLALPPRNVAMGFLVLFHSRYIFTQVS